MSRTPLIGRAVSNKAYFGKMPQLDEADLDESFVRGSGQSFESCEHVDVISCSSRTWRSKYQQE